MKIAYHKVIYPFEGYENLTCQQRHDIIFENLKNHISNKYKNNENNTKRKTSNRKEITSS